MASSILLIRNVHAYCNSLFKIDYYENMLIELINYFKYVNITTSIRNILIQMAIISLKERTIT